MNDTNIHGSTSIKATCNNFSQSLSGQSRGGGDSGQNTKSASLAKAAATDKYLENII